jgi:hypothetical protein
VKCTDCVNISKDVKTELTEIEMKETILNYSEVIFTKSGKMLSKV